jgi:hypothetical protein
MSAHTTSAQGVAQRFLAASTTRVAAQVRVKFQGNLAVARKKWNAYVELFGSSPELRIVSTVFAPIEDDSDMAILDPKEGAISVIKLGRKNARVLWEKRPPEHHYVIPASNTTWFLQGVG